MDSFAQSWAEEDGEKSHDAVAEPASILSHLSTALTSFPVSASPVLPPRIPSPNTLNLHTSLANDSLALPDVTSHLLTAIAPYLNASSLSPNYYGFVTGGATRSSYRRSLGQHLRSECSRPLTL